MYEDLHEKVRNTIIKQLEKHGDWVKPWKDRVGDSRMPYNKVTGNQYIGINIPLLWASADEHGYLSNDWAGMKQWNQKKESVRPGEKGTLIVYADVIERPDRENEGEVIRIPFLKPSYVFNRAQLKSYDPDKELKPELATLENRIEAVEMFVKNTGANIEYGGNVACYIPTLDKIRMPYMKDFIDQVNCTAAEAFYSTEFHELCHWTGHSSRLNRDFSLKFGSEPYAKEELVAELGASFLVTEFNIENAQTETHANYIGGWLKKLKDDKNLIISAASQASKATGYLHKLADSRREQISERELNG